MRIVYLIAAFAVVCGLSLLGFRGTTFTTPPIDVFPEWAFPGMKHQPKPKPQGPSVFFADGRADRPLPAGVVARGQLRDDAHRDHGRDATDAFARGFPAAVPVDRLLLQRGQDRYALFCAPCHGALGNGNGITKQYGMGATPTFHDPRLVEIAEGELFNTITHGKGTMFPYADKLAPEDRWAVIAYVRALQRAHTGREADVPEAHRPELGIQ